MLQQATQSEVYAIDLRGHGKSFDKSGDVEYINQYADDVADIIKAIRQKKPTGKIIIAGHSMGGGVALIYAMNNYKETVDDFLFLEPLIGHNSPAFRQVDVANKESDKALMLLCLEDKSHAEIAEIPGISPGNVGTKVGRIKDKLKQLFSKQNIK